MGRGRRRKDIPEGTCSAAVQVLQETWLTEPPSGASKTAPELGKLHAGAGPGWGKWMGPGQAFRPWRLSYRPSLGPYLLLPFQAPSLSTPARPNPLCPSRLKDTWSHAPGLTGMSPESSDGHTPGLTGMSPESSGVGVAPPAASQLREDLSHSILTPSRNEAGLSLPHAGGQPALAP